MRYLDASAKISISLAVEFEVEDEASTEEINEAAIAAIKTEANELLSGIEFSDEDIEEVKIWE
jgi:hypothetical protein